MIDTLEADWEKSGDLQIETIIKENLVAGCINLKRSPVDFSYALIILLRPSNVDPERVFIPLINFLLNEVTKDQLLIWPIHPRARKQLIKLGLWNSVIDKPSLILVDP